MGPVKLVRKIGKVLRGGVGTPQILLGCILGMMLGFTVGFNTTSALLILLLLLLNANGFLAAVSILVGKVLCLVLAPLTFRIGYLVIHQMGLEGLFRAASETPVVAFMNLHNYCQVGGMGLIHNLVKIAHGTSSEESFYGIQKESCAINRHNFTSRKFYDLLKL